MLVRVGHQWFTVSGHALARYQERVKPGIGERGLLVEDLRQVLAHAEVTDRGPDWANLDERADEWVVLSDAIAFPVIGGQLATCLTRQDPGGAVREARARVRQERAQDRGQRGSERRFTRARQSKRGPVAREARARRRAARGDAE